MSRAVLLGAGGGALALMLGVWSGLGVRHGEARAVAERPVAVAVAKPAMPVARPSLPGVTPEPGRVAAPAAEPDELDDTPDEVLELRAVEPGDGAGGPSDDEIRTEEERVAQAEGERMKRLAHARPVIDPHELGFPDQASMHAEWKKKLGIPADRPITMHHGTREGRPVIDVLVPPVSSASADD